MKSWLIFYNLASAAGWAYVFVVAVQCLVAGMPAAAAWEAFGPALTLVQSTMAFEILHALLGMVPSPVFVTAMQVSSRLWVIWGATYYAKASQEHWSLYLMVISWCLAEVPRYLFYASNLVFKSVPFPLFFVRYSGFMLLYPTGITGEIFQCLLSLPHWAENLPVWYRGLMVILVAYLPGSPFMINNMWRNRKSALRKRGQASAQAKGAASLSGLAWPVTNHKTGDRSTTKTNQAIWVASVAAVDAKAGERAKKEKNWRFGYVKHVEANVRASLTSTKAALAVAQAGLDDAHSRFIFVRNGESKSLKEAMACFTSPVFETHEIQGSGTKAGNVKELQIPYGGKQGVAYYKRKDKRNDLIGGPALKKQLKEWVDYGVIEQDCADAIASVADHPEWLDLSDHYFVLLGAGSAMGPLPLLLSLGANVYAVDIDRPQVWSKLIQMARKSSGKFTFPVRAAKLKAAGKPLKAMSDEELAGVAGANLLDDTPEISTWLQSVCPQKRVTVGNYTYLDGALHVQLSLACDAIISKLSEHRPDLSLAFLCTPTDVHAVPKAAHDACMTNIKSAPLWQSLLGAPLLVPNALKPVKGEDSKQDVYLVDGVVSAQGPNYMLAKRLQHWRSMVEHSKGHAISSNIAPSTATASVVHNAQFAAAYGGMHLFKPMEVMYAETSNAVMGALLIHDVRNPKAPANPKAPTKLANPLQIFMNGGFHGGTWRCGYKMGSIGELSAVAFYLSTMGPQLGAGAAALAGLGYWIATGNIGF